MTTESGEQLNRKYWKLCGWIRSGNGGRFHSPACQRGEVNCGGSLPLLHLDANLAIVEADQVFTGGWEVTRTGVFGINAYIERKRFEGFVAEDCDTFCECILKALIAAKEQSHV